MSYSRSEFDRPEERGDEVEIFPVKKIILFAFLVILSCAYLPSAILSFGVEKAPIYTVIPAFIIFAAGIAVMFLSVKRLGHSICFALITFFLYSYTHSPIIPAIAAAVILVFALGGFLSSLCSKKTYALLILIPLLSYLGAYALTGDWLCSIIAIVPFPSMVAQGILQRKNAERKTIILVSSALLIILLAGLGALALHMRGLLGYTELGDRFVSLRDGLAEYIKGLTVNAETEVFPGFGAEAEAGPVFDPEYVDMLVAQAFNMIPGFTVVLTFVLIYYSHSIQLALYKDSDLDIMLTAKTTKISMSVYAASLFVLSYILSLSTTPAGNPDILSVVAGNLRLMLTPGLLLVGFDALAVIMRKLRGLGFFVLLLLITGIFVLADYIVLILAGIGAVYIIVTTIDAWAQKHYSKKNS